MSAITSGYVPAERAPEGAPAAYRRLYVHLDRLQRARPSVADARRAAVRLEQHRLHEKAGTVHQVPLARYDLGRVGATDEGNPRLSFHGNARRLRSGAAALARSLAARDAGRVLQDAYRTISTARLRGLVTRSRARFDTGGGAHLVPHGHGLISYEGP